MEVFIVVFVTRIDEEYCYDDYEVIDKVFLTEDDAELYCLDQNDYLKKRGFHRDNCFATAADRTKYRYNIHYTGGEFKFKKFFSSLSFAIQEMVRQ